MRKEFAIVLALCFVLNCVAISGPAAPAAKMESVGAVTVRGPIRIDNNTCFNATNGVTAGNGTAGNPWVIENYIINGAGNGTCIYVGNTTDYFAVRNCTLHNASGGPGSIYYFNSSVMLYNVSHGTVHNNTLTHSKYGLYLYANSFNDTITSNRAVNNSETGIMMDLGSDGNAVNDNNASGNGLHGIYIYSGNYSILRNNTLTGNGYAGLYLYSAAGNWVVNCTVNDNAAVGLLVYSASDWSAAAWNTFRGNGYGVRIFNSGNCSFYNNDFINNTNQAYDNGAANNWHAGWDYTVGGNYWDDYTGQDIMNGPAQNLPGSDGLGDTPYTNIDGGAGASDHYPLMNPFNTPVPTDSEPPTPAWWGPVGTGAEADTGIFVKWDEAMNWTSVEEAFWYTDGTANYSSVNGTWYHDISFNSTFTPAQPLKYETKYWAVINCTARDLAGNMMDRDGNGTGGHWPSDNLFWNFTTTDRAPYVMSTTPAHGQVDVDPNKPFKILFSERMNVSSVEDAFSYSNGTETWNQTDGLVYWNQQMTEFTFAPADPLGTNQTFTATLDGNITRDAGGKRLDGGDLAWTFTTWLEPPEPHITDTYPPSGSFNVNVNTYINIAFDTEMDTASMEAAFSYTDGFTVWGIANGTYDWFSENTLFSFQPTERLKFASAYTVIVTSNATSIYGKKLDGNGNGIPDQNDDFVFAFTTTPEPPTVLSHYPLLNQMDVPTTLASVNINFTKIMSLNSVTNAVSIYPVVPFTPSFSGAGMNLTLVLTAELARGTQYRVTVLGTATDLSGIKLDGNGDGWAGDKFVFSFYTEGTVLPDRPRIIGIWPANNATVPVEAFYISVTFNNEMNKTSVEEAFRFSNATQRINGTFVWHVSGKNFRFTPTAPLAYNATYTVTLDGTAEDVDGQNIGNNSRWQYFTEPEEIVRDWTDWIVYGALVFLAVMVVILYMANRSLRKDLKRTRVKLKRLKREMGIEEKAEPAEPAEEPPGEAAEDAPQPEELPEENAADEQKPE